MTTSQSSGGQMANRVVDSRRVARGLCRTGVLAALAAVVFLASGIPLFAQHSNTGTASLGLQVNPADQLTITGGNTVNLKIRLGTGPAYLWGDSLSDCGSAPTIGNPTNIAASGTYTPLLTAVPFNTTSNDYVCVYDPGTLSLNTSVAWPHTGQKLVFNQSSIPNTAAGSSITPAVTVQVQDSNGILVASSAASVTIGITSGTGTSGATLSGTLTQTAVNGVATFSNLSINKDGTGYTLTATSSGISSGTSSTFNITSSGVSASTSTVGASPNSVPADGATTSTITVTLTDANSNPVSGKTVTLAQGSGSSTISAASGQSNSSGVVTFTVKDTKAEAVTYTATDTTDSNLTITQTAAVTFTAGALDHFKVEQSGGGAIGTQTAGTAFTLRITAQDVKNNTVTSFTSTATLTSNGTLTGSPVTSGSFVAGVLDPQSVTITNTGSFTITATASGKTGTSAAFTVNSAALDHFKVEQSGGGAIGTQTAGTAFTLRITAQDANNNTVTSFASTVSLTSSGTLTGSPVTSGSFTSGVLDPQSVTITSTGSTTITATGGGKTGTSAAFTVNPGALDHFKVEKSGGGAIGTQTAGTAFNLRITAQDVNNNTVTSYTSTATLSSNGTLTGSPVTSGSFVAGVLDPQSVTITSTGTAVTITATSGTKSGTSAAFTVNSAALDHFKVEKSGGGAIGTQTAGTAFNIRVTAQDVYNNTVTSFASTASLTSSGTLTGSPVTSGSFTSGVLDPQSVTITSTGSVTITATGSGKSGTSAVFTVNAGPATQLIFTTQTTGGVAATAFPIQPVVTVKDAYGNPASSSSVTLALTGSGTLTCPTSGLSVTPVSGVATFAGCQISANHNGDTLTASTTSPALSVISNSFNITGTATKLAFTTSPGTSALGSPLTPSPVVTVQDASGNTVTSSTASISFTFYSNPGGDALGGTTSVSAVAGVATFTNLLITGTWSPGSYGLTANASGLTSINSSTFSMTPGTAAKLVFTTQPGGGVGSTAWTTQPKVTVQDTWGNTVTSSSASVTFAIGTGTGTLTCTGTGANGTTFTPTSGIVNASGCQINNVGTNDMLTATSTGLTSATSGTFNITPRLITVTAKTDTKMYDGTTASSVVPTITTGSLAAGDTATWTQTFNTKDFATGSKVLIPAGSVNDGNGGSNYTITFANYTGGTISVKHLTESGLTANNKLYDGNTTATLTGSAGLLSAEAPGTGNTSDGTPYTGDTISVTGTPTGTFASSSVGTGITVNIAGLSLTGAQVADYSLTPPTTTANIVDFSLSVAPSSVTKSRGSSYTNIYQITLTPSSGASGSVALACATVTPTGTNDLTCSGFSFPNSPILVGTTGQVSVTLTATQTQTTYTITFKGTSGTVSHNATNTVTLTVQ